MADSSIWHRINPFHHRPPSTLQRYTPVPPDEDRLSSIDSHAHDRYDTPYGYDSAMEVDSRDVHTPAPLLSPVKHRRTPSILRTLAHHPSLSALKSRSKRRRENGGRRRTPLPLPPLPGLSPSPLYARSTAEGSAMGIGNDRQQGRNSPSPSPAHSTRKLHKASLKGSRSIPRNMRLSGEIVRSSDESQHGHGSHEHGEQSDTPLPPPPPPDFNPTNQRPAPTESVRKAHRREPSSVKRKPVPSPSAGPSITLNVPNPPDSTPETVRVRRMRFQFDLSMDGSPSPPTKSSRAARKRAASHSAVVEDVSPQKQTSPSRHLSTPAPPSPLPPRRSFASYAHPFTTQHPHPVPLTLSPRSYDDTFFTSSGDFVPDEGDFVPLSESGREIEMDDGLDLLVQQEDVPVGTPGGRKEDLRRGVLLDGAKHEKNAIRFFSRDTYRPMTASSSSRSSTPSFAPINVARSSLDKQDKRSSSPFEVKLSPLVSKRMSLDAFGTPSPLASTSSSDSGPSAEVELEELADESEQIQEGESEAGYQNTSLSTIGEGHSGDTGENHDNGSDGNTSSPDAQIDHTVYHTPVADSEDDDYEDYASPTTNSPLIPCRPRSHASAPPLSITQELFNAHGQSSLALQVEIDVARTVIRELELENELLRVHMQSELSAVHGDETDEDKKERLRELQKVLREKDEELEAINDEIRTQAKEHGLTVTQLRNALAENEGFFDALQQAHDGYAEQLTELREAHEQLTIERAQDARTLQDMFMENSNLKRQAAISQDERVKAETAIMELQRSLHEVEFQLSTLNDEHATTVREHATEVDDLRARLEEKEGRVAEVEDLLRAGLGRETELQRAQQQLKSREERIMDLQTRQTERQREIDSLRDELAAKDSQLADAHGWAESLKREKEGYESDWKAALRSATAKDSIIGVLRDKLRTASYEKDELIANKGLEERERAQRYQELVEELGRMRAERDELVEELKERQGTEEQAEQDLNQVEEEKEEVEGALRKAEAQVDHLEMERTRWEAQNAELLDLLNHSSGDESSISSLRVQLAATQSELSTALLRVDSLQADLEDAKASLDTRTSTLRLQDDELDYLRKTLVDTELSFSQAGDSTLRRAKEAERKIQELSAQLKELNETLREREDKLGAALKECEMERANAKDNHSRNETYLGAIDHLQLENATITKALEDTRKGSADLELKVLGLNKAVASLEEEKELLNVALESKETELILLQRQLGQGGTPKKTPTHGMAASTSRIGRSSMVGGTSFTRGGDVTPVPTRQLSTSASHSSLRSATISMKRESIPATPATPSSSASTLNAGSTPRAKAQPLVSSMRHNKTPEREKRATSLKRVKGAGMTGAGKPSAITRKSSLPVLKGRNSMELGSSRPTSRAEVGRAIIEDEVVM